MQTNITSIASILNGLIETCKDGQKGFRCAAENVKNTDYKMLFSDLSMQRQHFAGELKRLAANLGAPLQHGGSFSGSLHRGWMALKAAITSGDDRAILEECERGEDAAEAEYRDAAEREDLPQKVRNVLRDQAIGVQAAHERVHHLRECAQG